MYGKIKEGRLLNIEVYQEEKLLYKGKIEDAPDEIKNANYKNIKLENGWVKYII